MNIRLLIGLICLEASEWNGIKVSLRGYPNILVRHEEARCRRMKVLPEKLSVHLGSYLDSREDGVPDTFCFRYRSLSIYMYPARQFSWAGFSSQGLATIINRNFTLNRRPL